MAKMMRLLHLDAGRKYFGVPALKKIIDSMARAGLTHFQLYFSDNQGFRFGLDDLHFTTEFGEYDLASCLGDGYWEGPKRPSGCGGWLNTADMEQILAYAREKGIEIVPLLNMPGHMGCILEKYPHLRYANSRSSIDLENPEATAFALAILERYVKWFADRGCKYFHFGADEWSNDIAPGYPDEIIMGIDRIYQEGKIDCLTDFFDKCAAVIVKYGMIPMAFNDGICYAADKSYRQVDKRILVTYWSKGWIGYDLAPADWLEKEGYGMINSSTDIYCGCGCPDWNGRVQAAEKFDPYIFHPNSKVEKPVGAMVCYWSDRANADGQDDGAAAAEHLDKVLEAFGRSMYRSE